jgi:tRNA(Ile)-lysidine synthase TilS/MesJ
LAQDQLYRTCVSRGLAWVEDPTNAKAVYHRNAVRLALRDMYACR